MKPTPPRRQPLIVKKTRERGHHAYRTKYQATFRWENTFRPFVFGVLAPLKQQTLENVFQSEIL